MHYSEHNKIKDFGDILSNIIGKVYYYVVGAFFSIITVWLFAVNIFSTSYMVADVSEHTYYCKDKTWLNLICLFVFCFLLLAIYRTNLCRLTIARLENDDFFRKCQHILIWILFIEGIILVFVLQCIPRADQKDVMDAVYNFKFQDYTMLEPGGYIEKYPNQIGWMLIVYVISFVFGTKNYMIVRLINVFCLILIYRSLEKIAEYLGMGRMSRLMIYIYGIIFFPLTFYVVFVYGNIIGLAFALTAIVYEMRFLNRQNPFAKSNFLASCINIILAALFIALAIMIKLLFIIFLIAMIIYAMMKMIKLKKMYPVVIFLFMAIFCFMQNVIPTMYIENVSGYYLDGGISPWSYVAMGMQDNSELANGWYNWYNNNTYTENGYDTVLQAEQSKKYIDERIDYFLNNKDEAINFYIKKNASQWNNPTFQCFWIVQTVDTYNVKPLWIRRVTSIDGSHILYRLVDCLHMITLFGGCIYILLCRNKVNREYLLLEMVIIGGFIFHTFWEAKGQYTILYYILFIPIAIKGYSGYADKYAVCIPRGNNGNNVQDGNKSCIKGIRNLCITCILIIALTMLFSWNEKMNIFVNTDYDTEEYAQYVDRHSYDSIEDGIYKIYPANDMSIALASYNSGNTEKDEIYLTSEEDENSCVKIRTIYDSVYIQFLENTLYLDLNANKEGDNAHVGAYKGNYSAAQQWGFKKTGEEGIYYIRVGKKSALTYDDESKTVTVKEFDYREDQMWRLQLSVD